MKNQKSRTVITIVLLVVIVSCIYGIVAPSEKDKTSETSSGNEMQEQSSTPEPTVEQETTEDPAETTEPEATEAPVETTEPEVEHRTGEEIIGISEKDIDDLHLTYYESVINDVTGNWRLAVMSEDVDIQDYIYSYYQKYCENNSEIHGIVNLSRKTTTRINYVSGMLIVTELSYVDGEEHDAKLLYSGTPIKSYIVYTDNGDIEKTE